ncbi:MAG: hypothetical protein BIFFINMI_00645 [Phycisphaerae bacterium]|nr:hypothetical protein [Phycisphaerae bacterium]
MPQREQQQLDAAGPLNFFCEPGTVTIEAAAPASDGKAGSPLPRFSMVAYTGGPMKVGGWRYPVIIDLAGLAIPSQSRPIRFNHEATSGIGHSDAIGVQDGRLIATGVVSRDTAAAREVVVSAKNGFPWQASVGASVDQFEFVKESQSVLVNGRQFQGPVNVVRKATLGEISFVDLGADGNTSASVAAQAKETIMDGKDNPSPTTQQETTSAAGSETAAAADGKAAGKVTAPDAAGKETASPATAAPPAPPIQAAATAGVGAEADAAAAGRKVVATAVLGIAELRDAAAAELERIAAIKKVCGDDHTDIAAKAIKDGWDITKTELEVLRADRPKAPSVHVPDESGVTGQVLEAACMLTAGLGGAEKLYPEQALDIASRRFRGGIGLQELILEAAWANGYTGRNFRNSREVMRFAFAPDIRASGGFSTIDIGGILSNIANKFLLEGFFSVEGTWRNISAIRNVQDFKTVTSYRLIGTDQYQPVAPGGELKHGTLGNEQFTNKADTFGLVLSVDRRDIINDDLGAITTVPRKLGRGSGLKINDVFWTTFMNNAAFFTAAAKNYLTGAGSELTVAGLTAAEVAFLDQVDSDGKPIGIMPAIVLVPTALSAAGTQLYKATEIRDNTTNKSGYPTSNPFTGRYRVEVSRYLANAKYTGNSAKAWYLLSDPADLPVIEVAFLNGQQSPTIETAQADFDVLGIMMRGYHDFGCSLQDARGAVKSKGEA